MFDFLGLIYTIGKDIYKAFKSKKEIKDEIKDEIKTIDSDWEKKSGLKKFAESKGYKLRWSNLEKVESKKLDGYEILYEIDEPNKTRRTIQRGGVTRDPQILMGKKAS